MRVIGRLEEPTVRGLLSTLTIMVCLLVMLACGGDTDDRMVRRYARCLTDTSTTLHRLTTSGASGTVMLSAEAMEERLRGQLERGELTMGKIRAGYARGCVVNWTATVNRSRRELREERGRKALGRGVVRYQNGPRRAACQVRYGGDVMRRARCRSDGRCDDLGADDVAHPQS